MEDYQSTPTRFYWTDRKAVYFIDWQQKAFATLVAFKNAAVAGLCVTDERVFLALNNLRIGSALTDANVAIFDAANGFRGCIPGIHEVLRRQGLLAGRWCLDPHEELSPGQDEEITRVWRSYPELNDDAFVAENLDRWLAS